MNKSHREIRDYAKQANIWIIGLPEGEEEKAKSTKNLFKEIMEENFPSITRDSDFQI